MKTVYVRYGDLLPEFNRNVPYWSNLDNVNVNPDGMLSYDRNDGYFDQGTNEELLVEEFTH